MRAGVSASRRRPEIGAALTRPSATHSRWERVFVLVAFLIASGNTAFAQPEPPDYDETLLAAVFPGGAQRGTTVSVEIRIPEKSIKGKELHGLKNASAVLVDGPPGITVGKIENVSDAVVRTELTIAADAAPGRRMLRVVAEQAGITSGNYFVVGALPEVVEKEKNNEPRRAEQVTLPVVVNGRIGAPLDVDCFRFTAKKGQKIVAAAIAHGIDSRSQRPRAFTDAALELLDAEGRVIADAADVLGLDPLVEAIIPDDGEYVARVKLVNFQGYPEAVYRLTIGEVPFPIAARPVAVQQGTSAEIALEGPNVPPGTKSTAVAAAAPTLPLLFFDAPEFGTHDLPLLVTNVPEIVEHEPNDEQPAAMPLPSISGISGRFDKPGDVDWYRLSLKKTDRLRAEIHAQRYLRSPVDVHLSLYDAKGELLGQNDELFSIEVEQIHDFDTFDPSLNISPKDDGDYYLRVVDQTGASGPLANYHLTILQSAPAIHLHAWPDGVPIWGPGSTAGFVVTIGRVGAKPDVDLSIEGLPSGWTGSVSYAMGGETAPRPRAYMTITAPLDAKIGDTAEFRVVGRAKVGGNVIESVAQPLTPYLPTDRCIARVSEQMRAAVARDLGIRFETDARELNVVQGQKGEAVVSVVTPKPLKEVPISVNLCGAGFKANVGVQQSLPVKDGTVRVPLACESLAPGRYAIVVALAWGSETRRGMPGPCTPIIFLNVAAATAAK
jgi:hypothetical protein